MSARKRVLLDCDGILADFVTSYLAIVRHVTGRDFKPENVTQFDITASLRLTPEEASTCKRTLGSSRGFCEALGVYPRAKDGVAALESIADVYIVTSPWNSCPTWTHEREAWLKKHFGIPHGRVLHTSAKHVCRGDVFVDDKVDAVAKWQTEYPNALAVVWDTPHNQDDHAPGLFRTNDWTSLYHLVGGAK
jgi:5'(3')-deoxyribonucleotidase